MNNLSTKTLLLALVCVTCAWAQSDNGDHSKSEKTLKGCVQSQGSNYVLQTQGGQTVMLTGQTDLAQHAGHEVKMHGTWAGTPDNTSAKSAATPLDGAPAKDGQMGGGTDAAGQKNKMNRHDGQTFTVDSVEMVSDKCSSK